MRWLLCGSSFALAVVVAIVTASIRADNIRERQRLDRLQHKIELRAGIAATVGASARARHARSVGGQPAQDLEAGRTSAGAGVAMMIRERRLRAFLFGLFGLVPIFWLADLAFCRCCRQAS